MAKVYCRKRQARKKRAGICSVCSKPAIVGKLKCVRCTELRNRNARKYNRKLKEKFVELYGGKCNCCGESEISFLTLDHVNEDGAEERRKLSGRDRITQSYSFYRRIIHEGRSDNYQLLCYNCNVGKHHNNGVCPHKLKERELWRMNEEAVQFES